MPSYVELKERAGQHQSRYRTQRQEQLRDIDASLHGSGYNLFGPLRSTIGGEVTPGPLKDSRWDAWFQALEDAEVDGLADASVGARGRNQRGRASFAPSIYSLLNEEQGRSF